MVRVGSSEQFVEVNLKGGTHSVVFVVFRDVDDD